MTQNTARYLYKYTAEHQKRAADYKARTGIADYTLVYHPAHELGENYLSRDLGEHQKRSQYKTQPVRFYKPEISFHKLTFLTY